MLAEDRLRTILSDARSLGFLGPGPVESSLEHARAIARLIGPFSGTFVDLGAGGGIPGLVLALEWPESRAALVEVQQRRGAFLERAARTLDSSRIAVRIGRAEDLARAPELRGAADLVVARGFGAPAATAECAVGFLRVGGLLVVSEPPSAEESERRWPASDLARLGLSSATIRRDATAGVAVMHLDAPVHDRWPRRVGVPTKRPLW